MIKITVVYPYTPGKTFDMDYYCNHHMPLVQKRLGAACKGVWVEQGISGIEQGTPPAFTTVAQLLFDSVESFQAAFAPHAVEIMADVPNYTSIPPTLQISEVKI